MDTVYGVNHRQNMEYLITVTEHNIYVLSKPFCYKTMIMIRILLYLTRLCQGEREM